ncbi:hypothetical protein [Hyperthermus butylicus]|uniref:hypothetical protein n=1 Tax=Hyperthermus butylicus TaxID=54248 RepID=UPI000322E64A|nr:hypothetical protein [Hyperthermus butylicus]
MALQGSEKLLTMLSILFIAGYVGINTVAPLPGLLAAKKLAAGHVPLPAVVPAVALLAAHRTASSTNNTKGV